MQREAGFGQRRVEQTVGDHVPGAVMTLLARLEHEHDRAGKFVTPCAERLGRADEHRGMRIVAAGVHRAVDLRRERQAGFLLHRQRVHVAAEQYRPPVAAGIAAAPATQDRDEAGGRSAFADFEREASERRLHLVRGAGAVEADFGIGVDRAAEGDRIV